MGVAANMRIATSTSDLRDPVNLADIDVQVKMRESMTKGTTFKVQVLFNNLNLVLYFNMG